MSKVVEFLMQFHQIKSDVFVISTPRAVALMLLMLSVSYCVHAVSEATGYDGDSVLSTTEVWQATSSKNEKYLIYVNIPSTQPPLQGFPVIYVLDAETGFAAFAETVLMQREILGPAVVVGVGYQSEKDRHRLRLHDLTPKISRSPIPEPPIGESWGDYGGADDFLQFLQSIVKPMVNQRVKIDEGRESIYGHSLGGLFVLYVLFTQPESYNAYAAASPSIWWGDREVLNFVESFRNRQKDSRLTRRLLITVGGLEETLNREEEASILELDPLDEYASYLNQIQMIGNVRSLVSDLQGLESKNLYLGFLVFEGETHLSVIPVSQSRAARFLLLPMNILQFGIWNTDQSKE